MTTRNHEIIIENTGISEMDYVLRVEAAMQSLAGDLWHELDRDDFDHICRQAEARIAEGGPHILRFRYPLMVPHPTSPRRPLTLWYCNLIAEMNGGMSHSQVHETLVAGRSVYTSFSRFVLE